MSLREAIASLATGTYTVTRSSGGSYDANGTFVVGSTTTFPMIAVIETGSSSLKSLPEGSYLDDSISITTETELVAGGRRAAPALAKKEPDTLVFEGDTYEVNSCLTKRSFGEVHYEATAVRVTFP